MGKIPLLFWIESKKIYFHIGNALCEMCEIVCTDVVAVRQHYFKNKPGHVEKVCKNCIGKKIKHNLPGDWRILSTALIVESQDCLPDNAVPVLLIPQGLSVRRDMTVWEAAVDNSDRGVKVVDRTRLSGRNQSDLSIDVQSVNQLTDQRIVELENHVDPGSYLRKLKESVPLVPKRIEQQKKEIT